MIIVSDTSVLNYAVKIGCIQLLNLLFGEVIIPEAVENEMLAAGDMQLRSLLQESWLQTKKPSNGVLVAKLHMHLDQGQSEAIALATELAADFLLIDDSRGRKYAQEHGLNVTGLPGIFLLAKKAGLIQHLPPLIEQLQNETDFRAGKGLIQKVLALAGEGPRS